MIQNTPSVEGLAGLLGTWRGEGRGGYPTIASFTYTEELRFERNAGEDLLHFEQRTWWASGEKAGQPLHWESGFLLAREGAFEMVNSQNNGRLEKLRGPLRREADGALVLELDNVLFGNDPRMLTARRVFRLAGGQLSYRVEMSIQAHPHPAVHLEAELRRG